MKFISMFVADRRKVLDGLARLGVALCDYCHYRDDGHKDTPEDWATRYCDCKYGGPNYPEFTRHIRGYDDARHSGEQNGCCEVRAAFNVISKMTNAEWDELVGRWHPNEDGTSRRSV